MKLDAITTPTAFKIWVEPLVEDAVVEHGLGQLQLSDSSEDLKLISGKKVTLVKVKKRQERLGLAHHLKRNCAHLVDITQTASDGSLYLYVVFFNGSILDMGEVNIAISDHMLEVAKKQKIRKKSIEELCQFVVEACSIRGALYHEGEIYFPVLANNADGYLWSDKDQAGITEAETSTAVDSDNKEIAEDGDNRAFTLLGERLSISIQRSRFGDGEVLEATKIRNRWVQNASGAVRLAKGTLKFLPFNKAERLRTMAVNAMEKLIADDSSYLKTWDAYGTLEGELVLKQARAVGVIEFERSEVGANSIKMFTKDPIPEALGENGQIELTTEIPAYLKDLDMTWDEYCQLLQQSKADNTASRTTAERTDILKISTHHIELKLGVKPDETLRGILSISGETVQVERRMAARKKILEGASANPLLGLIIEENGGPPVPKRGPGLEPLTPYVREKIFKHDPTEMQVEAIKVALNTPDIALIQGPPGTGKTTVLAAILERLNEEYDKAGGNSGQVLVSGFQHDAVENIISRLSINALPTVKFGAKNDSSDFSPTRIEAKMHSWSKEIANHIRQQNPQLKQSESLLNLKNLLISYQDTPSSNAAIYLLEQLQQFPELASDTIIFRRIQSLLDELREQEKPVTAEEFRVIRALRIRESAFRDDGSERASDLMELLGDDISPDLVRVLRKAILWKPERDLDFLADLKKHKTELLMRLTRKPAFTINKPRKDVQDTVLEALDILQSNTQYLDPVDGVLADFLSELDSNPEGMRKSLESYNFVYAATVQQSEGKAIKEAKKRMRSLNYDTVVIDEAARCSPRDLLIPMVQAEKRIILVGDHRQLPHIVDQELTNQLENALHSDADDSLKQDSSELIKKSMFEYLFQRLKALEQRDGFPRTVTLDAQFRTHPLLGEFASNSFYQAFGEGYKSPLGAQYFQHSLSGVENQAAVWLDVPFHQGDEKRDSVKSRYRTAEANRIAKQLDVWLRSPQGSELSFGVISFYKAQVNATFQALEEYGISQRINGKWEIVEAYRTLTTSDGRTEERIRIGTVDSFQGMEFDVVFLSMVRCQNMQKKRKNMDLGVDDLQLQQQVFGHLMSPNRLCVSMSRQKRMLVVVGDSELIGHSIAKVAVPGLSGFLDLCRAEGKML